MCRHDFGAENRRKTLTQPIYSENRDDWDLHWEQFGVAAEKNPAQRFRQRLVARAVVRAQPSFIIDVGCGTGDLLALLRKVHPSATLVGIEPSETGTVLAARLVPDADFHCLDIAKAIPDELVGVADFAICTEVLEHVDDPIGLVRATLRLLRPGGVLLVTVPGGAMSEFDRRIGHRRHFSPGDLEDVLMAAGARDFSAWSEGFPALNAYRAVVIRRGAKLAADVSGTPTWQARLAMLCFDILLRFAAFRTADRGPQTVGQGKVM